MVAVQVLADPEELSRAAAREVLRQAQESVRGKGLFTLVLSGGSTPRSLYSLLATDSSFRTKVPWEKIHFFWGDERTVPPGHAENNYGMALKTLLSKVSVPAENIHPIRIDLPDPGEAATDYEETLRGFFHLKVGEFPRFDMILLGLGADGHTASLFPGSDALSERDHLAVADWVKTLQAHRITLTLPVLNQAGFILFLVSGQEKAKALSLVFGEKAETANLPARLVQPTGGRVLWLVDRAAGSLLDARFLA
jgi:6-phosphogluconolactonase